MTGRVDLRQPRNVDFSSINDQELKQFVDENKSFNLNRIFAEKYSNKDNFIMDKWFGNRGRNQEQKDSKEHEIDYDLRGENNEEGLEAGGETSDFEDWWGVEREGHNDEHTSDENKDDDDDDDGPDGGEMMPIIDF